MSAKQIGFIDLHIDEWHANNYPAWFRAAARAGEFELGYAWEESPNPDGRPLAAWCADFQMRPASGIEEVIERSDALCVLAPSNPEAHARLAELPLQCGKPLYIDKTFAPDRRTAEGFFAAARKAGTPLMSSSALRFGSELLGELHGKFASARPDFISTTGGGGSFQEYSIHQIEMIVSALGIGAKSVVRTPGSATPHFVIEYHDGKRGAAMTYHPYFGFTSVMCGAPDKTAFVTSATRSFENLLDAILEFFATGVSPIDPAETIEIAAIREAAIRAETHPGAVIAVP